MITSTLPDLVARLEALHKSTTEGWWSYEDAEISALAGSIHIATLTTSDDLPCCDESLWDKVDAEAKANGEFACEAHNSWPQLLTELKRLQSLYTDQVISHQQALCDIQAWQKASGLGREEWDYLQSAPDELADKIKQLESERDTLRSANERMRAALSRFGNAAAEYADYPDSTMLWTVLGHPSKCQFLLGDLRRAAEAVNDEA